MAAKEDIQSHMFDFRCGPYSSNDQRVAPRGLSNQKEAICLIPAEISGASRFIQARQPLHMHCQAMKLNTHKAQRKIFNTL